jgi:hypothetical protein
MGVRKGKGQTPQLPKRLILTIKTNHIGTTLENCARGFEAD